VMKLLISAAKLCQTHGEWAMVGELIRCFPSYFLHTCATLWATNGTRREEDRELCYGYK
jgi:hypothetical protein